MSSPTQPDVLLLLRQAYRDGVTFRLRGAEVAIKNADRTSPDVLARLRELRAEVWSYLGGQRLDQPSFDVMFEHFPDIKITVPQTVAGALAAIAQIEADADAVPDRQTRGVLGLDIETVANPGEEIRQPVRIGRDGIVHQMPALDPEHLRRPTDHTSTAGLDPHRSTVRLVQLYGGGASCVVLDTNKVPSRALVPLLSRRKVVIHNAAFELGFLHHAGLPLPRFEDTMHAAGLLIGNHRRGLADVAMHFMGIDLPKDLQTSDWSAPTLSMGQITYAALDAIVARRLWPLLLKELPPYAGAYVLQRDAILPTVRMQARGPLLDKDAHRAQIDQWSLDRAKAKRELTALLGEPPPDTPVKIRKLLERVLPPEMLAIWPKTDKSGELSIADKALKLCPDIPELNLVRIGKKHEKMLSTFGDRLANKVHADGRLRASFNLAGAKTGRMRCSNPNLQNLPRDLAFRNSLGAAEGYVLVVSDYSSMELRSAAEHYGDDMLRKDLADGVDLHRRLAAQMFGIPEDQVTREQRQAAKPINFGTIYGAGGRGLAASAWATYGVRMTVAEATTARNIFFNRYRQLAHGMSTHADSCQRRGYIEVGRYGRVIRAEWEQQNKAHRNNGSYNRSYNGNNHDGRDGRDGYDADPEGWDDDEELAAFYANTDSHDRWRSNSNYNRSPLSTLRYTLCCNTPIQGACADIVMRAMVLVENALICAGIPGGLILAIHDELVLEVPEEFAELAKHLLEQAMIDAFHEYYPEAPLNGLVDAKIVRRWGEAKG